jgi:hypothetical protein
MEEGERRTLSRQCPALAPSRYPIESSSMPTPARSGGEELVEAAAQRRWIQPLQFFYGAGASS